MIKKFDQYINESVLDQMTGPNEETLRKHLGEENYKIYKAVSDAKDSIKPPFELSYVENELRTDVAEYSTFAVKFWFLRFRIRFEGDVWSYSVEYNDQIFDIKYRHWIEIYHQMISDANKFCKKEINTIQTEVNRNQDKIENIEADLKIVNDSI